MPLLRPLATVPINTNTYCFISQSVSAMATSFSPTTPVRTIYHHPECFPNPSKVLLSLRDTYYGRPNCVHSNLAYRNELSWGSAANNVTIRTGVRGHGWKNLAMKQASERRTLTIRRATKEEIEAEKSSNEKNVRERMEKTIASVRSNFNSIRTGRATPSMLDRVEVEYYGIPVSLKSIAQINTSDSSSLVVVPYEKSSLKAIEKAIVSSDVGMTPANDGEVIRLSVPQLTSDRRKELCKLVGKQAEEGKVALRNIRRDAIKACEKLEKEKKFSEDNVKDLSSDLQKVVEEYMKKIESIYKQKEKELMTV